MSFKTQANTLPGICYCLHSLRLGSTLVYCLEVVATCLLAFLIITILQLDKCFSSNFDDWNIHSSHAQYYTTRQASAVFISQNSSRLYNGCRSCQCRSNVTDMQFLRKKMIFYTNIFKNLLKCQHKLSSMIHLLQKILKVQSVIDKKSHFHLVHLLNLFNLHAMIWMPMMRIAHYVPEIAHQVTD